MRTIVGSVIGALAMGVLLIAYNSADRSDAGRAQLAPAAYDAQARLAGTTDQARASDALAGTTTTAAGPVLVKCEPNQQALMRDTRGANGEAIRQIECVSNAASSAVYFDAYGRPVAVPDARFVTTDIVAAPRAVRTVTYEQPRARRVVYRQSETARRSGRSWKKSALIIGGSAGTGAGVGAIAGGKKGALIGAALGGGAASIYEAIKR